MLDRFQDAPAATFALVSASAAAQARADQQGAAAKSAALDVQGMPVVAADLAARTRPYIELRSFAKKENQDTLFWATFQFWQQTLLRDAAAPSAFAAQ